MARGGPQSATSEFFICINNQPELNFGGKRNPDGQGFAAFGQVTSGMDVVKKIQLQPDNKQYKFTVTFIDKIALSNHKKQYSNDFSFKRYFYKKYQR